jgi:hypothetical protein
MKTRLQPLQNRKKHRKKKKEKRDVLEGLAREQPTSLMKSLSANSK